MVRKGIISGCARIINLIFFIFFIFLAATIFYSNAIKIPSDVIPLNVPDSLAQFTFGLTNVNERTNTIIVENDSNEVNINADKQQRILSEKQKLELLKFNTPVTFNVEKWKTKLV